MIVEENYLKYALPKDIATNVKGVVSWRSPSNIALVKYWGKYGNQFPKNPSISFTLDKATTITTIQYEGKKETGIELEFSFEDSPNPAFETKLRGYLIKILDFFPFLDTLHLKIASRNYFPHSAGIASSASSMSALVLCLLDIEKKLGGYFPDEHYFLKKASFFARLASGSAARSVYPFAALWGKTLEIETSSDAFSIGIAKKLHPIFKTYHDSILIINSGIKAVSSSAGHALMEGNPFAEARFQKAGEHILELLEVLQNGNLERFVEIIESEALQLHALMMCSEPSFMLMQPNTLKAIQLIRNFRKESGIPLCFTLDAGPNIHLLYPDAYNYQVARFIKDQMLPLCINGQWIDDRVGEGPIRL